MKLTAKELRIGNLINFINYRPSEKGVLEQTLVTWEDIRMCVESIDFFHLYYKPIPLTEEWLLRMGAISNPYQDRYELGDLHFECDKTKGETILWCEKYPHMKFVHQVQNYIYATKGEELTIKESVS